GRPSLRHLVQGRSKPALPARRPAGVRAGPGRPVGGDRRPGAWPGRDPGPRRAGFVVPLRADGDLRHVCRQPWRRHPGRRGEADPGRGGSVSLDPGGALREHRVLLGPTRAHRRRRAHRAVPRRARLRAGQPAQRRRGDPVGGRHRGRTGGGVGRTGPRAGERDGHLRRQRPRRVRGRRARPPCRAAAGRRAAGEFWGGKPLHRRLPGLGHLLHRVAALLAGRVDPRRPLRQLLQLFGLELPALRRHLPVGPYPEVQRRVPRRVWAVVHGLGTAGRGLLL
ncbi:MAG: hypothetical protein AVDCRST_MAG49-2618, partial [uncultured Thermomicrobiales bacterium]